MRERVGWYGIVNTDFLDVEEVLVAGQVYLILERRYTQCHQQHFDGVPCASNFPPSQPSKTQSGTPNNAQPRLFTLSYIPKFRY